MSTQHGIYAQVFAVLFFIHFVDLLLPLENLKSLQVKNVNVYSFVTHRDSSTLFLHWDSAGVSWNFMWNVAGNKRKWILVNYKSWKNRTKKTHSIFEIFVYGEDDEAVFVIMQMCLANKTTDGSFLLCFISARSVVNCRTARRSERVSGSDSRRCFSELLGDWQVFLFARAC